MKRYVVALAPKSQVVSETTSDAFHMKQVETCKVVANIAGAKIFFCQNLQNFLQPLKPLQSGCHMQQNDREKKLRSSFTGFVVLSLQVL